jgi:hypothetical protein
MFDMLELVREQLGFDYKLINSTDGTLGIEDRNGNCSGIMGMLQRQEANFSISAFSSEPTQVIDFYLLKVLFQKFSKFFKLRKRKATNTSHVLFK